MECTNQTSRIILLQSGGRDSAIAAANLLEQGYEVLAVTFAAGAKQQIELPRKRAYEIAAKYSNYSWRMIEFGDWERPFKQAVMDKFGPLPRSCLTCALSKITAALSVAASVGSNRLAVGYTTYQNSWAEQTEVAIASQRANLASRGYALLLPAESVDSKESAMEALTSINLTSSSLENPCCIARYGTQPTDPQLTVAVIDFSFAYMDAAQILPLETVDCVGSEIICR